MGKKSKFSYEALRIDCAKETELITTTIRQLLREKLKRKGVVVALSGGVDSSVTAALCVRAIGKNRVLGLLLPEKDSSDDTIRLSRLITSHLDIETVNEDITQILRAFGCYKKQEEAIRKVVPEYGPGYKAKIVLPSLLNSKSLRLFSVVVLSPEGRKIEVRLTQDAYLSIVAATNFKQRTRKTLEYYHADRMNYAVAGTPNRQEYDQGFFVKLGDGSADLKPIAHLYKTQVYQMAEYLEIPEDIRKRPPTTDTYSMPQTQEEFYFSLPYDKMDLCLYGKNNGISEQEVANAIILTTEQVKRVYQDIDQKRRTTSYLHLRPMLIKKVKEIKE